MFDDNIRGFLDLARSAASQHPEPRKRLWVGASLSVPVLLVAGLVFLWGPITHARDTQPTTGTIVGLDSADDSRFFYSFTAGGRPYERESEAGSVYDLPEGTRPIVGTPIPISYRPDDPSSSIVGKRADFFRAKLLVFGLLGLIVWMGLSINAHLLNRILPPNMQTRPRSTE